MVDSLTWREVSDSEKEKIRSDAKKLLDEFSKKLGNIEIDESYLEKGDGVRREGVGWGSDEEFRKIMFSNAPLVEEDLILAEKGGWKK